MDGESTQELPSNSENDAKALGSNIDVQKVQGFWSFNSNSSNTFSLLRVNFSLS